MTAAMQAARLVEPGRFVLERLPLSEPAAGEVRVRLAGCGVCGSDLPPWRGTAGMMYPLEPGAPGHEAWGVIDAVADDVDSAMNGRAVTFLSHRAFAEYATVPANHVVPLPDALRGRDVPGEPIACAVNVARRSAVASGDIVVILGTGFLGALLIPLLRMRQPHTLLAVSRRRFARSVAMRMGADDALQYDEIASYVNSLTGGRGADVVIEATGEMQPLDIAGSLCRERGRLVIAGYHQSGRRCLDVQLWNSKGLDVINAHERDPHRYIAGMREGIERICQKRLDLAPLITHREPLRSISSAFQAAAERSNGFLKVVVIPGTME